MPQFELEYTLCLIQRDIFSFARKSHRQEGGDPRLDIDMHSANVTWTLINIDHGELQTEGGTPRVDRIDFYFLISVLRMSLPSFPMATGHVDPALRFPPTDSQGTERPTGTRVPMVTPIARFFPITDIRLQAHIAAPFEAIAADGYLHLDVETGPASIYGTPVFEAHLGIEAEFLTSPLALAVPPSSAMFCMSHDMYATVLRELQRL